MDECKPLPGDGTGPGSLCPGCTLRGRKEDILLFRFYHPRFFPMDVNGGVKASVSCAY